MVLLDSTTRWCCPNCPVTDLTAGAVANRYHQCAGLGGVLAPLVPDGIACKVEKVEREDYIGKELVQYDASGRPIMAVITTRDDGTDCIVLAPTAQGDAR